MRMLVSKGGVSYGTLQKVMLLSAERNYINVDSSKKIIIFNVGQITDQKQRKEACDKLQQHFDLYVTFGKER